jgi:hypothetical protein
MAGRGPQTFKKRQKEQQRKEKQQEKLAKRLQRKQEKSDPTLDPEGVEPEFDEFGPVNQPDAASSVAEQELQPHQK